MNRDKAIVRTVLIVDDDPSVRLGSARSWRRPGCN